MHILDKFFEPRSLVLVGASSDPSKMGYAVLTTMLSGGFKGDIYLVNPKGGQILGLNVYKKVAEIPEIPDLAIIIVPPPGVYSALEECADKGITSVIIITAGFAELGEKGAQQQREFAELSRRRGFAMLGPNCYGVLSPPADLFATFIPLFPPEGPIGIISQSGNVGMSIANKASELNFGCSRLVGIGNEAILHSEDLLSYMAQDEKTKVILSYLEGFRDGRRFYEIARESTRKKPFILIKGGATEAGARAANSHTASLASQDSIIEAMCRQAGIIRARDMNELMNLGIGFITNPLPKGRRVGIVTGGGGWGVLAADACSKVGFEVVKLPDDMLQELDTFMPAWWSRNNPVDMVAGAGPDTMAKVLEMMAKSDHFDCMILMAGIIEDPLMKPERPSPQEKDKQLWEKVDRAIPEFQRFKAVADKYGKPVVIAYEIGIPAMYRAEVLRKIAALNIASYSTPEEAVRVLSAMADYHDYLQRYV